MNDVGAFEAALLKACAKDRVLTIGMPDLL